MTEPIRQEPRARLTVERDADRWRVAGADLTCPFEGSIEDVQWYLRYQVSRLMMPARPDLLWLHAAGVARHGAAMLIVGSSGSGKSTMAARFLARGYGYLGDELMPVNPSVADVHPFAMAPAVRIEAPRRLPSSEVRRLAKRTLPLDAFRVVDVPLPVRSIVFPVADDAVGVEPLSPARAAVELLAHIVDADRDRFQAVRSAAAVANAAPAVRVGFADVGEAMACAEAHHDAARADWR